MNSINPGWTADVVGGIEPLPMTFQEESCRNALGRICQEFGLEFRLVQREIIVDRNVGFDSAYVFEYGRGKGLNELNRDSVIEKGVVTRLYVYGGSQNLGSGYRDGSKKLIFSDLGTNYLDADNINHYDMPREGSVTFEDIYPKRTGSITAVVDELTVTDASLDFDINANVISGSVPKIVFKSGALSGYEFEIASYNHASKTIKFKVFKEANGDLVPGGVFVPEVDDTYTLVGIDLPQAYKDVAEADLLEAGQAELEKVKLPRVNYTLPVDERFVRLNGVELACGMRVTVKDTEIGLNDLIRIYAIQYPLVNPSKIVAQIADSIPLNTQDLIIKEIKNSKTEIIKFDRTRAEDYRQSTIRFNDFFKDYFDPDGQFSGPIKPGTVQTGALSVGTKSQNFALNLVEIEPNYEGDPNRIRISGGELIHFEIEIPGLGYVWEMDPVIMNDLVPAEKYFVYARCNKAALSGTWVITTERILSEQEVGFYHFWLGVLYPEENGKRYFMFTKGMTYIVGDTITTGRIKSQDDINFFDLNQGTFNLGDEENGLDWGVTNEGKLTIRGAVIANAIFADDGVIQNLRVNSLKTANEGKRLEILADDGGDPATPLHNLKFYDSDGNLAVTLDTAVDNGSSPTPSAGLKIEKNGSVRKGLFTQNGMMSSGSFLTDSALPTNQHMGSILGILREKFFTLFGIRAGVIGYDSTSPTADNPSYGGWFNTALIDGLNLGVKQTSFSYTCTHYDTIISCYNGSPINVDLPANPRAGKVMIIRRNAHDVNIRGNGKSIRVTGLVSEKGMGSSSGQGDCAFMVYDGTAWTFNRWKL